MTKAQDIKPLIKTLEQPITCHGISVRTNNLAETREDSAKLGSLWQSFYQSHVAKLAEAADIYGIYHHYERDDTGDFDVVAAWAEGSYQGEPSDEKNELVTVTIPAGKYMVFSESGAMPDTVIDAWEKVWAYFNDPSCEHTRTYGVDFEQYLEGNLERGQVDLHIGIE